MGGVVRMAEAAEGEDASAPAEADMAGCESGSGATTIGSETLGGICGGFGTPGGVEDDEPGGSDRPHGVDKHDILGAVAGAVASTCACDEADPFTMAHEDCADASAGRAGFFSFGCKDLTRGSFVKTGFGGCGWSFGAGGGGTTPV